MTFEKAIEYLKKDLEFAVNKNYSKSSVKLKLDIINSLIEERNALEKSIGKSEFDLLEKNNEVKKLLLILKILGIRNKSIYQYMQKTTLWLENSLPKNQHENNIEDICIHNELINSKIEWKKLLQKHLNVVQKDPQLLSEYFDLCGI